ncbi:MAG: SDR family oxidoreductase [Thermonemataceae bacterium]|mgnify:CR=1 FL=1
MFDNPFHQQELRPHHFLITGGAGFVGANLVAYLVKYGAGKVRILDNLSTGFIHNIQPFLETDRVEFIEGDIRDLPTCQAACQDIHFVLHQAALGSVPRSIDNPIATNEANITGFLNMLVAAKDNQVKRFVYAASSSTYGDSQRLPKVEEEIGKPLSPYALTKYVNELYADVFHRTYGLDCIGLRYFNIYGPKQSPAGAYAAVIPLFIKAILEGEAPYINGDGEQTRDFTFVENAVQANIKAALAPQKAANQIYNVACGERISINQLFQYLKNFAGTSLEAIHRTPRKGDVRNSLADITKAQKLLNYQPNIKIEQGLEMTFQWFKKTYEQIDQTN